MVQISGEFTPSMLLKRSLLKKGKGGILYLLYVHPDVWCFDFLAYCAGTLCARCHIFAVEMTL